MSPVFRILIVFLFLQFAGLPDSSAESPFKFESTPGKLPKDIVPRHYSIYLRTDLEKFVTAGKVEIEIEALKPAKQIVLNALDLEIAAATITINQKRVSLEPKPNAEAQTVTFSLPETLAAGKYILTIEFTGHLREQAQGLYYLRYTTDAGKKTML